MSRVAYIYKFYPIHAVEPPKATPFGHSDLADYSTHTKPNLCVFWHSCCLEGDLWRPWSALSIFLCGEGSASRRLHSARGHRSKTGNDHHQHIPVMFSLILITIDHHDDHHPSAAPPSLSSSSSFHHRDYHPIMYRSPTCYGTGHQDPPEIRSTSAGQHVAAEGRNAGNHVLERLPDSLWRRWAQNGTKKGHGMDMLVAISALDRDSMG